MQNLLVLTCFFPMWMCDHPLLCGGNPVPVSHTDRYGDALPADAWARYGTVYLRREEKEKKRGEEKGSGSFFGTEYGLIRGILRHRTQNINEPDPFSSLGAEVCWADTGAGNSSQASRKRDLFERLQNPLTYQRAVHEIALLNDVDLNDFKRLAEAVVRAKSMADKELPILLTWEIGAVAALGRRFEHELIGLIKDAHPSDPALFLWLPCLARIGTSKARPVLQSIVKDARFSEKLRQSARVALANLGDQSIKLLNEIEADLKSDSAAWHTIRAMIQAGPQPWITKSMVEQVEKRIDPSAKVPGKYFVHALVHQLEPVVLLGLVGEKAASSASRLADMCKKLDMADDNPRVLTYRLALARIAPKLRNAEIRTLCTKHPLAPGLGLVPVLASNSFALVDTETSKVLAQACMDKDPKVRKGAIGLLSQSGLSARDAVPVLVDVIRDSREHAIRLDAATVMADVADSSFLPEIRALLNRETSKEIRERLARAIRCIERLNCYLP